MLPANSMAYTLFAINKNNRRKGKNTNLSGMQCMKVLMQVVASYLDFNTWKKKTLVIELYMNSRWPDYINYKKSNLYVSVLFLQHIMGLFNNINNLPWLFHISYLFIYSHLIFDPTSFVVVNKQAMCKSLFLLSCKIKISTAGGQTKFTNSAFIWMDCNTFIIDMAIYVKQHALTSVICDDICAPPPSVIIWQ